MTEFLAPGVFIEEVSFRARSIAGVRTATGSLPVRASVRDLLADSPAFRALDETQQRQIASDMVSIAAEIADGAGDAVDAVDFPAFVADLITSTFGAIVGASIAQMDAYRRLLEQAAGSLDDGDEDDDDDARRRLLATRVRRGIRRIVTHDERPSFFDGRLLDARDLAAEQESLRPRRRLRPPP